MYSTLILQKYARIIENEVKISDSLRNTSIKSLDPQEVLNLVMQIQSVVKSSTVLRCCAVRYGLSKDAVAHESVSAHTNLVQTIVDRVLSYQYGSYFSETPDGFTYREIMETIRRHDLPENHTGDTPDDGNRDEKAKLDIEREYLRIFASCSPQRERNFEEKVCELQRSMEQKDNFCGRLIYLADKVSAILAVLGYDEMYMSPMLSNLVVNLSDKDRFEMTICEEAIPFKSKLGNGKFYKASEMWTIDYFKVRKLYKYDSTGLITAILIMYTLAVKDKWYNWREKDYEENS